jgi:RNA polymerase sigma factor (sigma-70 family)
LAVSRHDAPERKRLLEVIVGRVQRSNEEWAQRVLLQSTMRADERNTLVYDLCVDLYEALFRALMDPARLFWEENFWHCLRFERQHIHHAFMMREGFRVGQQVKRAQRVPRPLVNRLQESEGDGGHAGMEIEDERAQKMLLAVEHDELLQQVLRLPDRLKAVVLLLYWEGRTEKETARVLGITDRTVRNRLQNALKLLRDVV